VCGYGTTCSVNVSQSSAVTDRYIAYLGANSTALPPPTLQETSDSVYVTWTYSGWRISLSASPTVTFGTTTVTASANADVGPTPYYIEIFNENGTRLDVCGSGTACSFSYTPPLFTATNLVAFVSDYSTALPPAGIEASSNVVQVDRLIL